MASPRNIRIVDSTGTERSLNQRSDKKVGMVIFIILLSFFMGIFGGVAGVVLATSAPENVRGWLGIDKIEEAVGDAIKTEVIVEENSATIDVVESVSPAVVSILFTKSVSVTNPFDIYGQGQSVIEEEGGGTGFIITSDGLIVTNKHVVSEESANYTVVTQDGATYDAEIIALDPTLDLAVIKIEATGLPVVELGDSDDLKVGQTVIAIGNALSEFQNTVTSGVLSATGRSLVASDSNGTAETAEELDGLLQTDAAINLGNSGGPLVNLAGQVIGINTVTASGDAEGIGFAIPINEAKSAIESVKKTGKIVRPFLGVNSIEITEEIAEVNDLSVDNGYLIAGDITQGIDAVVGGSPANKAGLREGDIITKVNDKEVGRNLSLVSALRNYAPGDEVEITFNRDGDEKTVKVELTERPE